MSAAISTDSTVPPEAIEPLGYEPGRLIAGKLQLVRELGRGGMGVVWVAHNRVLDVHVAMKIIDLARAPHPKRLAERVLQEARASARLAHPAICRVFEFGETEEGDPFIVSELLHGETLGDVLSPSAPMNPTLAVQTLLPVVEGLVMAHSRGIVHRDVKPENIFLSRDEVSRLRPKLLDFGIARMVDTDRKITIDGTLLGTPDYMSPEQARGEGDVDARTDVWAVCVVLYETIAGQRPFDGNNYNALLWTICQEQPKPLAEFGVADERLWSILQAGLEKNREDRWNSMRALGMALAEWLLWMGVTEDICGFSLRSTWLAEDGRVALSQAPLGKGRGTLSEEPTSGTRHTVGEVRGETGGFETHSEPTAGRVMTGYWLVGGAGALAFVAAMSVVLAMGTSGSSVPPPAATPEVAESEPQPEPRPTASTVVAPIAEPVPSATVSAAPSASAAPSVPTPVAPRPRYRRRSPGKPDPQTYDFGF